MYGTTSFEYHGFRGEDCLSVSLLKEANDSCDMASLGTSNMDLGMTVFSHYKSMGAILWQRSNPISPKTTWNISPSLPDDSLYLIWLQMVFWKRERKMRPLEI